MPSVRSIAKAAMPFSSIVQTTSTQEGKVMKELGFLYVLANSAMPNMVKVGKTTRSSLERAEELSRATGLPTPFIVIYGVDLFLVQ